MNPKQRQMIKEAVKLRQKRGLDTSVDHVTRMEAQDDHILYHGTDGRKWVVTPGHRMTPPSLSGRDQEQGKLFPSSEDHNLQEMREAKSPEGVDRDVRQPGLVEAIDRLTGEDNEVRYSLTEGTHMLEARARVPGKSWRQPMAGLEWNDSDGHIEWVHSGKGGIGRGVPALLLDHAHRMAENTMGIPHPQHDVARSPEGVQWSRAQMRRRGEPEF